LAHGPGGSPGFHSLLFLSNSFCRALRFRFILEAFPSSSIAS
jgi:hypothetical protein